MNVFADLKILMTNLTIQARQLVSRQGCPSHFYPTSREWRVTDGNERAQSLRLLNFPRIIYGRLVTPPLNTNNPPLLPINPKNKIKTIRINTNN